MENNINISDEIIFHSGIEQKSEDWFNLRLGKFTGSEIYKLMGARGLGKTGETYIFSKIAEVCTGTIKEIRPTDAMLHGIYYEPIAANHWADIIGLQLSEVGFVENRNYKNCGASPDRVNFDNEFGIEIKCPDTPANHVRNLLIKDQVILKKVNPEYYWQIMFCMLISNFQQWQFISYNPLFHPTKDSIDLRLFALDVYWNQKDIDLLIDRISEANEMRENILKSLIKY